MNAQPQDTFEIQNGARVTPSPFLNTASGRNKHLFYDPAELFSEIESDFVINTFFKKSFEAMWNAMGNICGANFWVSKDAPKSPPYKYGAPWLFAAACFMNPVNVEKKGFHFLSANGMIKAQQGSFQFVAGLDESQFDPNAKDTPPVKKMSLEDAFNVLILASFNGAAPHKLELVGGNEDDRAIYYQAIKAFNESVSENMRFRLDPELAQYVENALPANNEMAAFMNRVQPDKTGVAANHGNVPPGPTIIPDAEAGSQNPRGKEPKASIEGEAGPVPKQAAHADLLPIPNITLEKATLNGEALQAEDYQNLASRTFDPQLTLAKAFIGSRVYRAHPDEHLPVDLLKIYESAAGQHGASVKRFDQKEPSTLPLSELTFPKLPDIKSISGSLKSYKFGYNL
jgi:hypothetical protein